MCCSRLSLATTILQLAFGSASLPWQISVLVAGTSMQDQACLDPLR